MPARTKLPIGYKNDFWRFIKDEGKNLEHPKSHGHAIAWFECLSCGHEYEVAIYTVTNEIVKSCASCSIKRCGENRRKPPENLTFNTKIVYGLPLSLEE